MARMVRALDVVRFLFGWTCLLLMCVPFGVQAHANTTNQSLYNNGTTLILDMASNHTFSTSLLRGRQLKALPVSYRPGYFSKDVKSSDGLVYLSDGLDCKRIATSGQRVKYANGKLSKEKFHGQPDAAAVFPKKDGSGGWYYVSNAEMKVKGNNWNHGGVGRIEFDKKGKVVGYKKLMSGTRMNCGGGKTPWDTWITCEEIDGGKVWQVDPKGKKKPQLTAMGTLGFYESFAYDESTKVPTFYVTRDRINGVVTRFTPDKKGMECYKNKNKSKRWCTLNSGSRDYLFISGGPEGSFTWTKNVTIASKNAQTYYQNVEGIDAAGGKVYFVSKKFKRLVILNLKEKKYTYGSTKSGAFNHQPDQLQRLVDKEESILYFCEDGGPTPGVFGRTKRGNYFTIMVGRTDYKDDETTGLAFSPDGRHQYVSYQEGGFIYDCTRKDKRRFDGSVLDIKYHKA